jgi:hypothetical protein
MPRSVDGPAGGTASATVLSGAVVPCGRFSMLLACVTGSLGAMLGRGSGVTRPANDTTIFSTVGARLGAELPLTSKLGAHVHIEGDRVLTPTRLLIDGSEAWAGPSWCGAIALGLAVNL